MTKEDPKKFRFTRDIRLVNGQTKKNAWALPHADPIQTKLSGDKTFFQLYFTQEYWQFPLAKGHPRERSKPESVYGPKSSSAVA